MLLRLIVLSLFALGVALAAPGDAKAKGPAANLKLLDTDKDGTVDLVEAKKAATDRFDKRNKDKDNTIDREELKGRLSKKDFAAADTDKDGTLTKERDIWRSSSSASKPPIRTTTGSLMSKSLVRREARPSSGC